MRLKRDSSGVSCLEIQVALVIFGIALAGICPVVVMQMKLLKRIESKPIGSGNLQIIRGQRMIDGTPYLPEGDIGSPPLTVLQAHPDSWARRLGVAATFRDAVLPQTFSPVLTDAIRDDSDAILNGSWTAQDSSDAQAGAFHQLATGQTDGSATWTFDSITPGRYRVMISWPTSIPIPSDAAFQFTNGSSNPVTVLGNQTVAISGGSWRDLGNHSLGSSLQLRLPGSSVGAVAADAVRISTRNDVTIVQAAEFSGSAPAPVGVSARVKVSTHP